ncbi:MAG: hypothetical protein AAFR39_02680 [Pseudomonadota bacterium]
MAKHSQSLAELVEKGDHLAIVLAYSEAAEAMFAENNADAAYFFLTHAYIHALEAGIAEAQQLAEKLKGAGRL